MEPAYADKKAFLAHARSLGIAEANGALQRPEFIVQTSIAVECGALVPADSAEAWNAFDGSKLRRDKLNGSVVLDDNTNTTKKGNMVAVRASELKQVMIAASKVRTFNGANFYFSDLLDSARRLICEEKAAGNYKGNTSDGFVRIARAQIKSGSVLSEDEVRAALQPTKAVPKERTERKELAAVEKILVRLIEGNENSDPMPSPQAKNALAQVRNRLSALGDDSE